MRYGSITVNDRLEIEVASLDHGASVRLKVGRVHAQILADILRQHAGVPSTSGLVYGKKEIIPAVDLTPDPKPKSKKTGPVYFGTPKRRGAIKL